MLSLLLRPSPSAAVLLDLTPTLYEVLPALHATSFSSLDFWTEAQLWQYVQEAAQRIAQDAPLFVEREAIAALAPPTAEYALPARTVATLHASLDDEALTLLSVSDAEALSQTWPADVGPAAYWLPDVVDGQLRLYPIPSAGGTLWGVLAHYPALSPSSTQIRAPRPLRWYFALEVLAAARGHESPAAMPEVSQWAERAAHLFRNLIREYWA